MKLSYEQIKAITCGATQFTVEEDGIIFHRFTQAQYDMYEKKDMGFFVKSKTSSGIKLCFRTDSRTLYLDTTVKDARSRTYFSFDVLVDDKLIGCLDNFSDQEIPRDYSEIRFPVGRFGRTFNLGAGLKTVTIHLPWNKITKLHKLCLSDGAAVEPVKPEKKMLVFGDSITVGFDCLRPSRRQVCRIAQQLNAEEFNKCIGGERYCPDLSELPENFMPDYIYVAYGTNDYTCTAPETFYANSRKFFENLDKNYPGVKTFVITPIWRVNYNTLERPFKSFFEVDEMLHALLVDRPNTVVIPGFDLVPHSVDYFGDYGLHPNMEGHDQYFENMWKVIQNAL